MIALQQPAQRNSHLLHRTLVGFAGMGTIAITVLAILSPGLIRGILATLLTALITATWFRWPRAGLLVAMGYLPLLALLRRLLIPIADFTSYDPLLLVVPATTIVVLARLYLFERRPLGSSMFAKVVLGLLVLTVAEAFNPEAGNLASGVTALLFLAAPIAWFFIGQELPDTRLIGSVLGMLLVLASAIALYGLYQTAFGFPEWDQLWITMNGYTALGVGGVTRAFGTFSSAAEYGTYMGMALVVALTLVIRGRFLAVVTVPVLGLALFIESGRQAFILAMAALVAVVGLGTGRPRVALLVGVLAVSGTLLLERLFGAALTQSALASENPLISHQVGGLADPLNPQYSTLTGHVQIVLDGLATSLKHPFGLGAAATTPVAEAGLGSTEVDLSNAFLSLGWIGGLLFGSVVATSLWRAFRLSLRQPNVTTLACVGLLIVTLGEWLNGGYYAVAPLVWLVIGWSSRSWADLRSETGTAADGVLSRGKVLRWPGLRWFTTTLRRGEVQNESSSP